jgi:hypothetical protein
MKFYGTYRTIKGETIDLDKLNEDPTIREATGTSDPLRWLLTEAAEARDWTGFQTRTARGVVEGLMRVIGDKWTEHELAKVQSDLMGQIGIRHKQLGGSNTMEFLALMERFKPKFAREPESST